MHFNRIFIDYLCETERKEVEFEHLNKVKSLPMLEYGKPCEYEEIRVSETFEFENDFAEINKKIDTALLNLAKKADNEVGKYLEKNKEKLSEIKVFYRMKSENIDQLRSKNVSFTRSPVKVPYLQREIMIMSAIEETTTKVEFSFYICFAFEK